MDTKILVWSEVEHHHDQRLRLTLIRSSTESSEHGFGLVPSLKLMVYIHYIHYTFTLPHLIHIDYTMSSQCKNRYHTTFKTRSCAHIVNIIKN